MAGGYRLDQWTQGIKITLSSYDTNIQMGQYAIAFQGVWGASNVLEWNFNVPLEINRGLIP